MAQVLRVVLCAMVSASFASYSVADNVGKSSLLLGTNSRLGHNLCQKGPSNLGLRGNGDAGLKYALLEDKATLNTLLQDLFTKIDKDKSGSLELDELKNFLHEAGIPDFNLPFRPDFNIPFKVEDEASRGLTNDDANHDGLISRGEYVASVTKAIEAKGLTAGDACHLLRDTLSIL